MAGTIELGGRKGCPGWLVKGVQALVDSMSSLTEDFRVSLYEQEVRKVKD